MNCSADTYRRAGDRARKRCAPLLLGTWRGMSVVTCQGDI
jgi:hypothetical protein